MTLARAVLRARKPRSARASYERLKADNRPLPPRAVAGRHAVEETSVAGARCVWLDRRLRASGVLVYLHGGAFIRGPVKEMWEWFGRLCQEAGMAGLMVDYALTPEHAHPTALDQTLAVTEAIATEAREWFLAGDSAGGGLAVAACYRLRDEARPLPRALVLVSPWLDLTMSNPQARANERIDSMLSLSSLARGSEPYARGQDPRDPHISPLNGDPAGLPPMLVHAGSRELFVWDIRDWAQKCARAGVRCEHIEVRGGFHDFPMAVAHIPEARTAVARQAEFLREHA